jgi:hypothetical protein
MEAIMIKVLVEQMYKAVKEASKYADHKTLPILNCIHAKTDEGRLVLTGYDLDEASRESAPYYGEDEIEFCVPAQPFRDWLKVAAECGEVVTLQVGKTQRGRFIVPVLYCELQGGLRSRAEFYAMDAKDYPIHGANETLKRGTAQRYKIVTTKGVKSVSGYPVQSEPVSLFIVNGKDNFGRFAWVVYEESTGLAVCNDLDYSEAVKKAQEIDPAMYTAQIEKKGLIPDKKTLKLRKAEMACAETL